MRGLIFSLALLAAPAAAQTASIEDLRWLSGRWLSCDEGREVSEHWFGGRSGELYGASYTRGEGFEFMRIGENDGGAIAYFAQPMGQAPTAFPLARIEGRSATFENPEHDFPQRIIYRREGARLHARIEGVQDGAPLAFAWSYRRVSHDNGCPPS
jgi:hypothetical protein